MYNKIDYPVNKHLTLAVFYFTSNDLYSTSFIVNSGSMIFTSSVLCGMVNNKTTSPKRFD